MDVAEFEGWYRHEHDRVVNSLYLISGSVDAARDSTDEAFARAAARWSRVRNMASPAGWTFRVALNVLRREMRRRFVAAALATCCVASGVALAMWVRGDDTGSVRTVDSSPSTERGPSPKARAERIARELRARAVLPKGAVRYLGSAPDGLAEPFESRMTANLVDAYHFWPVSEPSESVAQFLRSHVPAGLVDEGGFGTMSKDGVVTVRNVKFFDPPATSSSIVSAELYVSVASRTDTTSCVRVGAQVVWRDARDPAERVRSTDRVVTVTREPAFRPDTGNAPHRVVVTDRRTVERLERAFNDLLVAVPGEHSCPQNPSYVVEFSATKTSDPDVVATVQCGDVAVTVHGRRAAPLDAMRFSEDIAALFGE